MQTFIFQNTALSFYTFKGRICALARDVGRVLGYANNGNGLADAMVPWKELVAGEDYEILVGSQLRDFKRLLADTGESPVSDLDRLARVTILYETGFDLVCIKTDKPLGIELRRFLVTEVMPKLRRGETIVGKTKEPALNPLETLRFLSVFLYNLVDAKLLTVTQSAKTMALQVRERLGIEIIGMDYSTTAFVPAASAAVEQPKFTVVAPAAPTSPHAHATPDMTGFYTAGEWYWGTPTFTLEETALSERLKMTLREYVKFSGRNINKETGIKNLLWEFAMDLKVYPCAREGYIITDEINARWPAYFKFAQSHKDMSRGGREEDRMENHPYANRALVELVLKHLDSEMPKLRAELATYVAAKKAKEDAKAQRAKVREEKAAAKKAAADEKAAKKNPTSPAATPADPGVGGGVSGDGNSVVASHGLNGSGLIGIVG